MTKEFDKRNMAKSRRVCEAMAEAASTGKRVLTERERQILAMWPRFEDGEYVWFGDVFIDGCGYANEVRDVRFDDRYVRLVGVDGFQDAFIIGERVKRPVQSVLDADGVEIKEGDTVWLKGEPIKYQVAIVINGLAYLTFKTRNGDNSTVTAYPRNLTHVQPDSWERFIEDMQKSACGYFGFADKGCDGCPASGPLDCNNYKTIDLVRRANALAGIEVSE